MGNLLLEEAQSEINDLNSLLNKNPEPPPTQPKPIKSNIFTKLFSWFKDLFS